MVYLYTRLATYDSWLQKKNDFFCLDFCVCDDSLIL